jgi:predicted unusual protein kinase regulating ubiquinone biosynthesis (AarF/ABC1/UbiB family)
MDFVEGIRISDREALVAAGVDPGEVAKRLNDAFAEGTLPARRPARRPPPR